MKQLVCEMCGSTDLVKDEGVFVCQGCGCKYSVEEAKKMMVEGVVQVEGTVKVDETDKVDNYIERATELFDAKKYLEAYHECKEALRIAPRNPYLKLISIFSDNSSYVEDADWWQKSKKLSDDASDCLEEIHKEKGDIKEFGSICKKYIWLLNDWDRSNYYTCRTGAQAAGVHLIANAGMAATASFSEHDRRMQEIEIKAQKEKFQPGLNHPYEGTVDLIQKTFDMVEDLASLGGDYWWSVYVLIDALLKDSSPLGSYEKGQLKKIADACKEAKEENDLAYEKEKREREKEEREKQEEEEEKEKQRVRAYWEQRPEQYRAAEQEVACLEQEVSSSTETVAQLKKELEKVRRGQEETILDKELASCKKKRMEACKKLDSLGLFKRSEKRALRKRIEKLEEEIRSIKKKVKEERKQEEDRIITQMAEISKTRSTAQIRLAESRARLEFPFSGSDV